jgi:hypothetical protein
MGSINEGIAPKILTKNTPTILFTREMDGAINYNK